MPLSASAILAILACVVALAVAGGYQLANWFRMRDYGWKLALIFGCVFGAIAIDVLLWNHIKLGIDLAGGLRLIYEVKALDEVSEENLDEEDQQTVEEEDSPDAPPTGRRKKAVDVDALISILERRINPTGLEDIVIRKYGQDVEIIIPKAEQDEIDRYKEMITAAGRLQFRIVVNPYRSRSEYQRMVELATEPEQRKNDDVKDGDSTVARWYTVGKEKEFNGGQQVGEDYVGLVGNALLRDEATKRLVLPEGAAPSVIDPAAARDAIRLPSDVVSKVTSRNKAPKYFDEYLKSLDPPIDSLEVLMETNDPYNVTGEDLQAVSKGFDQQARPCVNFVMDVGAEGRFGGLTGEHAPDPITNTQYQLGIILDGELLSAPNLNERITRRGQISGGFSDQDVEELVTVLRAGSLPATLEKTPLRDDHISAILGEVTINQGKWALIIASLSVLVFMMLYYRLFAGTVACLAVLGNLALILAVMIIVEAKFTLPGLAGLVLMVGMAVDANVLIFERIREELAPRGAKLRMAIRNGFGRATTTIVDANITTLITAIVLYAIGTEEIKGFAVTLILGILTSMFTAIFCSRVAFDVCERKGILTQLSMSHILGENLNIDWIGKRRMAGATSIALIVIGMIAVGYRGASIMDIDLLGGSSVDVIFTKDVAEKMHDDSKIRDRLDGQLAEVYNKKVNEYNEQVQEDLQAGVIKKNEAEERTKQTVDKIYTSITELTGATDEKGDLLPAGSVWKIDTSVPDVESLKLALQDIFQEDGKSQLEMQVMLIDPVKEVDSPNAEEESSEVAKPKTKPEAKAKAETKPKAKPEAKPKAKPKTKPKAKPEAKPETKPEPKPEPTTDAEVSGDDIQADPLKAEPRPPAPPEEDDDTSRVDLPSDTLLAYAGDDSLLLAQAVGAEEESVEEEPATSTATSPPAEDVNADDVNADDVNADDVNADEATVWSGTNVQFDHRLNKANLRSRINDAVKALQLSFTPAMEFTPLDEEGQPVEAEKSKQWKVALGVSTDVAQDIVEEVQTSYQQAPKFYSSGGIDGQIAGDAKRQAAGALFISLLGIVAYIWIRFQRVMYGLAAVVALVHDVLITLGAIALSAYLAKVFGFLLIEEFRISLPMIAAFLTIIGYSLNDTIVVFDRIREVRGKSPELTQEMINKSINQTLSRTLLTSLTTLLVVMILYAIGGPGIHGFAFALVVGVAVGTYSSIFVASPMLMWMTELGQEKPKANPSKPVAARA